MRAATAHQQAIIPDRNNRAQHSHGAEGWCRAIWRVLRMPSGDLGRGQGDSQKDRCLSHFPGPFTVNQNKPLAAKPEKTCGSEGKCSGLACILIDEISAAQEKRRIRSILPLESLLTLGYTRRYLAHPTRTLVSSAGETHLAQEL